MHNHLFSGLRRATLTAVSALALAPTAAYAIDCDAISHTDGKYLCRAMYERSEVMEDGWQPRLDFDSGACNSIRNPMHKAFCYGLDNKSSTCQSELSKIEKNNRDARNACDAFVSIGRKIRSSAETSGTCSVDDSELDAWCDAFKSSRVAECSTLPSHMRRSCVILTEVMSVFSREMTAWEKLASAVAERDPRVVEGGAEGARERAIARDEARRLEEQEEDYANASCSNDLSMAPVPEGADQREYTREQYAALWARHQGRDMSKKQARTLMRGCIGITALNLSGGGNPINEAEAIFGSFAAAKAYMDKGNRLLDWLGQRDNPAAKWLVGDAGVRDIKQNKVRYVLFGKLFWSNQRGSDRSKPDDAAFGGKDVTGEIDLEDFRRNYDYRAQPGGYINFDYGFWDEAGRRFWHANHMEYSDPKKAEEDPMVVYNSSLETFAAGYTDFDRVIYGVALAKAYDAKGTATFWMKKR